MSVDWRTVRREQARDRVLEYELRDPGPLSPEAAAWLAAYGKTYRPETLAHFRVGQALCVCYLRAARRRRSLWSEPVLTIPAGPVTRIYRYTQPEKADRWRVTPTGYPPQWIGDLTGPEVLLCEGEWDCLAAYDHGFAQAATHTAGAGTWLAEWTPLFPGKRVTICYDRDVVGMRGTARVARALWPVAASVRIVDLPLPGTPEAKDVSDYFRGGATPQDFRNLLQGARGYGGRVYPSGRRPGVQSPRADVLHP